MGAKLGIDGIREDIQGILDVVTRKKATSADLATAGKLQPAKAPGKVKPNKCACAKSDEEDCDCEEASDGDSDEVSKVLVEIFKASNEEQTVTGIALQPETVDAQGDIYSAAVIKKAAYNFLSSYNKQTKLGRQHADFKNWENRFALVESYLAPMEMAINSRIIKAGTWIVTVKVLDSKVWKMVKDGKITGFSIGGRAKVEKLSPNAVES